VGSKKIYRTHISGGVSNVSFSFRVMTFEKQFCFLVSCHSKRNDHGDCKSRNVINL
jgi:cobalamin-dependent methionine synthase I